VKIFLSGALALSLLAVVALVYANTQNARVIADLRDHPRGERAQKTMILTLPSGKVIPVNYLRADPYVYAAADFPWWRELEGEGGRVTMRVRGEELSGHARAIRDDPDLRASVFERLRPTAPSWTGTMVQIELHAR